MTQKPRWGNQYEKTTLVRVSTDTHMRIKNLIRPGESIQDVIGRAISLLESGNTSLPDVNESVNGAVNVDVNDVVNKVYERVNADINNKLTKINERLDNLIPGIEHQGDEITQLFQMYTVEGRCIEELTRRLEALETQPVHVLTRGSIPEEHTAVIQPIPEAPEEKVHCDEHDQGPEQIDTIKIEGDLRNQIRMKMNGSGMTIKQISEATGINQSAVKKLKSEKNNETVNLSQDLISKVLSIEKSSQEGT